MKKRFINDNDIVYSGAGVLLIENIQDPKIILVQDKYKKSYVDPGGKTDRKKHENNIRNAAASELFEETGTTILFENIFKLGNKFILKPHKKQFYKLFLVLIETIPIRSLRTNIKHIQNIKEVPEDYKETNNATKVRLRDIKHAILSTPLKSGTFVRDIYGKKIYLHKRIVTLLKELFKYQKEILSQFDKPLKYKIQSDNNLKHYIF